MYSCILRVKRNKNGELGIKHVILDLEIKDFLMKTPKESASFVYFYMMKTSIHDLEYAYRLFSTFNDFNQMLMPPRVGF